MKKKILIVDDDRDLVETTKVILESAGYEVLSASNGEEGAALARSKRPALILLDIMMTYDSEGADLARALQSDPATKSIPIIVTTGISKAQSLPFGSETVKDWVSVRQVLEKPVDPKTLLSSVAKELSADSPH